MDQLGLEHMSKRILNGYGTVTVGEIRVKVNFFDGTDSSSGPPHPKTVVKTTELPYLYHLTLPYKNDIPLHNVIVILHRPLLGHGTFLSRIQ